MATWLVVGLGNPGSEYKANRHNIGFMVIDQLANELSAPSWRNKFGAELADASDGGEKLVFVKPQQYMNVSGIAAQQAATFYKVAPQNIVVVHDEMDLPFDKLRVKVGGGHGGHNGLRSLSEALGADYLRVRCGVGKPVSGDRDRVVGHVLSDFSKQEKETLPVFIKEAASAVRTLVKRGHLAAMNDFNKDKK